LCQKNVGEKYTFKYLIEIVPFSKEKGRQRFSEMAGVLEFIL